jgi:hypothetical protein
VHVAPDHARSDRTYAPSWPTASTPSTSGQAPGEPTASAEAILTAASGFTESATIEPHTAGLTALNPLSSAGSDRPICLIVDDAQWIDLQKSYFRAGHAHAGVLVILGLVAQLLLATPTAPGWSRTVALGILVAAIMMPAGFFLSVMGRGPQQANQLCILIWLGAASLPIGLFGGDVGLIVAGVNI